MITFSSGFILILLKVISFKIDLKSDNKYLFNLLKRFKDFKKV